MGEIDDFYRWDHNERQCVKDSFFIEVLRGDQARSVFNRKI